MSNCVEIYNPEITLGVNEVDISKLLYALYAHEGHADRRGQCESLYPDDLTELVCMAANWFLVPGKNVNHVLGGIRIVLGRGNSSHTWRDLKQTFKVIAKFAKTRLRFTLLMSDESDGHRTTFYANVVIEPKGDVTIS